MTFSSTPHQERIPKAVVSKEEGLFITEEVQSLLKKGAIVQVKDQSLDSKRFYSNLFTVPKKGGERRPIINLKALNRFIPHVHFKMEGIQSLRELILPGDFMIKLDLKDAYFSIPIHTTQQRFLSFMWEGQSYQFTCLPFGLSSAPRTFTKVMKPLVAYLRSLGIRLVIYLDDMLILAQTKEELLKWRSIVLDLLENLGFLINYKKSEFEPTQSLIFLGFLINSVQMEISLPREKVSQAIQEAQNLLRSGHASARQLAHLIGVFTSTLPAILPAPLHYRGLQNLKHQILKRGGYDAILQLSDEAREDLVWWTENLPLVNGQPLVREQPSLQIESDASLKGWGAVCEGEQICGPWAEGEKNLHLNCLELLAASHAVQAFARDKRETVVQLHLDSATAVAYINHMGGTRFPELRYLATTLWGWCLQRRLFLVASHIPGVLNTRADLLSRSVVDRHDWQPNPAIFQRINSLWGPLQVDLFASRITKQIERFFSWKPDPQAEAVDAFKQNWAQFRGYANPPWGLVGRCLQQVLQQGATIVLVTPLWPTQSWYPALFPLLLDNPRLIPRIPDLLISPQSCEIPLPKKADQLVAWYISGNRTKVQESQRERLSSYWHHGEAPQPRITIPPGGSGSDGACKMAPVQFLPL